jgi:hypothetical protein
VTGEPRDMDQPHGAALLLAFDTDEPEFARGFEAGALWAELRAAGDEVEALVHAANTEMVLRIAEACGRRAVGERVDNTWTRVIFTAPETGAGPSPGPGDQSASG